jgi:MFS family permease
MTPQERRSSISLAGIFALRMLGLFLILPVFAVYAKSLPGGDNAFLVGLTLGIYGLTQSVLQIPYGVASDRFGRKPVIIIGLVLFAAGSALAAAGTNIWLVMIGRAVQGAGAISAAVTAFISDSVRDRVVTKAMAMVGASIGLTFALSLIAAPPLAELWGVPGLFWLTAALSVGAIFVVWKIVPDVPAAMKKMKEGAAHKPWPQVVFDGQLLRLNAGIFFLHCVQMAIFVVIPPMLVDLGLPVLHHWYIYLPAVLIGFAVMMKPIAWADKNGRTVRLLQTCVIGLMIVFAAFYLLTDTIWEIAVLMAFFFVGFNILEATLPGLVSRLAPPADKGLALGVYNTTQSFGLFMGGAAGGWISQHISPQGVFVAASFAMLLWYLLTLGLREPAPRRQHRQGEALNI